MNHDNELLRKNESLHTNVKWLKPQLQAAYARWENGDTSAYEDWRGLMEEEIATEKQAKACLERRAA